MNSKPLLTIITVNYNNATGLQKTMASILPQLSEDVNYVVIDGGSTDNSPEIISQCADKLLYHCSESDGGIYQGMNKGVAHANGQYLLFINSGDELLPDILRQVLPYLRNEAADIIYGNYLLTQPDSSKIDLITFPDKLTLGHLYTSYLPHPASFIRRQLLIDTPYNENLRIIADWEFFITVIIHGGASTLHIPLSISKFEAGGISTVNQEQHDSERLEVIQRIFTPILRDAAELSYIEHLDCFPEIKELSKTHKLHKRVRPLLRFVLKIDKFFGHKRR